MAGLQLDVFYLDSLLSFVSSAEHISEHFVAHFGKATKIMQKNGKREISNSLTPS
jgi:hypothetical protein